MEWVDRFINQPAEYLDGQKSRPLLPKAEQRSVRCTVVAISYLPPCHGALICHLYDHLCHIFQFVSITFNSTIN